MRPILIGFALFSAFSFLFAACGQDTGSTMTSTNGTGGAPNCNNALNEQDDPCHLCVHKECCSELSVCNDHCVSCFTTIGINNPSCGKTSYALYGCAAARCDGPCWHYRTDRSSSSSSSGGGGDGG
jgi:hypothetical protein